MKPTLFIAGAACMFSAAPAVLGQPQPTTAPAAAAIAAAADAVVAQRPEPIAFERETLPNGLRVIYAPMDNAPVVHVRVLYHVGSRDERPDRNGFAHMFEHMMFRGSANVASEQHMKLIQGVGGNSNAFTSFDQTTYTNTLPNNHLEMALYLEADRMASFKVSQPVFETERGVVKEEWRLRYANQPYGSMNQDLFGLAFTTHNYRWLTIGDMDHLAAANIQELQDFHDTYYVPNNACLIIAGEFDVAQAKQWVNKYYGWIPKGDAIQRLTKAEPPQAEPRGKIVYRESVPVARVAMAYKAPDYRSDDQIALDLVSDVIGGGRSSRLYQELVSGSDPVAANASMGNYQLQDPSVTFVGLGILPGKDPDEAVRRVKAVIAKVAAEGVTAEELEKVRTQAKVSIVNNRQTAQSIAEVLGEEEVFGGDAGRANDYYDKLMRVTPDDLKRVAKQYFTEQSLTVVQYRPGKDPSARGDAGVDEARAVLAAMQAEPTTKPVPTTAPATQAVSRRKVAFPADYPKQPPINDAALSASFEKGVATTDDGVQVITLTDRRLPVVSVSLVMRGGSHAVEPAKEGVASLTASMLTRGSAGMSASAFAEDLEGRAISVNASDDGDTTRVTAFAMADQLGHAVMRMRQVLLQPDFPADEFAKLKRQSFAGLMQALSNPGGVADREFEKVVFGDGSPLGKQVTPQSLQGVTLEDVKAYYARTYKPADAILVFAGAIDPQRAEQLARELLQGWSQGTPPKATYDAAAIPEKRKIVLIDNPAGQQAVVRMGIQAYDLKSEDRFAGSVAGQILSSGIDSKLGRVLRAEKGLTYGAYGYFRPNRNGGAFEFSVETKPETTGEAIASAIDVFEQVQAEGTKLAITADDLAEAKRRVAGLMVLDTQTIQQQAGRRVDTVLNGYPVDYYDHYAQRIAQVEASQVREVLDKYLKPEQLSVVVVAKADDVKAQLEKVGEVTIVPMPLAGMQGMMGATTRPAR